jgi:metal-responsive CopG/Arc/MetJ family transcriptional regulator
MTRERKVHVGIRLPTDMVKDIEAIVSLDPEMSLSIFIRNSIRTKVGEWKNGKLNSPSIGQSLVSKRRGSHALGCLN